MSGRAYRKMLASGGHALHTSLLVRMATNTAMLGFLSAWLALVLHGLSSPPPQPGRDIRRYARFCAAQIQNCAKQFHRLLFAPHPHTARSRII
jgi:hypothetical protein